MSDHSSSRQPHRRHPFSPATASSRPHPARPQHHTDHTDPYTRLRTTRHLTLLSASPQEDPRVLMPHDPNLQEQWFQLVGNYDIRRLLYHLKTHECSTLKDIQPVCASSSQRTTALSLLQQQGLIRFHKETGIWHRQDTAWQGKTLGATLEWHVREIMQRQLHGLARHGVQVASMKTQGDLDVLAFLPRQLPRSTPRSKHGPSHWLVAIACKSSTDIAPDRFPLILRRFQELKADLSVLFVDTRDTTTMYRAFQTAVNTSINKRLHPRSCPGVFSLTRWSGDTPRIIALLTAEVSLTISLPSIINYLNAWQEI